MTIRLPESANAWGTPDFNTVLKREIEGLDAGQLPLQEGLSLTSHVADSRHTAILLRAAEEGGVLRARVGLFYAGIIAGCSCADDPTPVDEVTEYCEMLLEIDLHTAEAAAALVED